MQRPSLCATVSPTGELLWRGAAGSELRWALGLTGVSELQMEEMASWWLKSKGRNWIGMHELTKGNLSSLHQQSGPTWGEAPGSVKHSLSVCGLDYRLLRAITIPVRGSRLYQVLFTGFLSLVCLLSSPASFPGEILIWSWVHMVPIYTDIFID